MAEPATCEEGEGEEDAAAPPASFLLLATALSPRISAGWPPGASASVPSLLCLYAVEAE